MIGIGAFYGGPELEGAPIDFLVSATMQAANDVCGEWETMTTPRVNVNFWIPGSVDGYDEITGIGVGRVSRKQRAMAVRVRVPKEIVKPGASVQFIVDSLLEASRIAADVFSRKGIEGFDLAKAVEAVDQIKHLVHDKLKARGITVAS
jgi:hypothetical protein